MNRLDMMTAGGLFAGVTVLSIAIYIGAGYAVDGLVSFIDMASFFIVIGGLLCALAVNFTVKEVTGMLTIMKQTFYQTDTNLAYLIQTFTKLATRARRHGLLALERDIDDLQDPFMRKGIALAVDGLEPALIKEIMEAEITAVEERHQKGINILAKAGELAPAFGMLGTTIGLILMLRDMSPEMIGPKMAIALITTFYGSVLANLVFIPMAGKLQNKSDQEVFIRQIVIEGVLGVQAGQNPKILEEKLKAFLSAAERETFDQLLRKGDLALSKGDPASARGEDQIAQEI